MQKKGIVMQIANGQAVVMTKDCEFHKIPVGEEMTVGLEVEVPMQTTHTVQKKPRAWYRTSLRQTGVLAASVLIAVGVWGSQALFAPQAAYAYVTVDINPSVEFSIDSHQKVLDANALNDDGQQVLAGLQVKGLPVDQAVASLTEVAKNKGFFHDQSEVIITASPAVSDDKLASDHFDLDQIETDLVAQVKTATTTAGSHVDVEGIRVSQEVRDAAKKAGLSPGKYAVYLNAQSNGIDISVDELKQQSITTVVSKHGEALAHVVQALEGGPKLDHLLDVLQRDGKIPPAVPGAQESKEPQPDGKKDTNLPPGQQKKDDSGKNDNQNNGNSSKKDPSSDREHGDKGNSGHDGNHKDDAEHDRGNQGGKDKKGTDSGDSFFSNIWSWFENHGGGNDHKGKHGGNEEQSNHDKQHGQDARGENGK